MSIDERAWTFHPHGDDLAICLIRFGWQSMRYNFVPRSLFLDKETCTHFNFGPGDETFVIGRFINHEGRQQNLPTARFGCIAQMPIEPVDGQESFLVEARSIGGYSGSPVFVYIPVFSSREGVEDWTPPIIKPDPKTGFRNLNESLVASIAKEWGCLKTHGPWLLGVDWGDIHDWQPVCNARGEAINRTYGPPWQSQVRMNTGIMTVVPAWKLIDMIDGPIADQRNELIAQIRQHQQANPPAATKD